MGSIADDMIQDGMDDLAQGGWCDDCGKWVGLNDLEWGRCCKDRETRERKAARYHRKRTQRHMQRDDWECHGGGE